MLLLIDAGNTRLKWGMGGPSITEVEAREHSGDWEAMVASLPAGVTEVALASVLAPEEEAKLVCEIFRRFGVSPWVARSVEVLGRVRNGYQEFANLGVDRWLAVLAAAYLEEGPCLVVDAGTAMTLDAVDAEGVHLGGYIVPGIRMMMQSLLSSTGRVRFSSDLLVGSSGWGRNTRDAVVAGVCTMAASMVEGVVSQLKYQLGQDVRLILTGGGVASFKRELVVNYEWRPDLVLEGLSIAYKHRL